MTGAIVQKPFDTIIPVEKAELLVNKSKSKYLILKNKFKKKTNLYVQLDQISKKVIK